MSLGDLHAPVYVAVGDELSQSVPAGAKVRVPLYASFLTSSTALGDSLTLRAELYGWNALAQRRTYSETARRIPYHPWMTAALEPLLVPMPDEPAVLVLAVRLGDATGAGLHRHFFPVVVGGAPPQEGRAGGRRGGPVLRTRPGA